MKIEKQLPKYINGQWLQKEYKYSDLGSLLTFNKLVLSEDEARVEYANNGLVFPLDTQKTITIDLLGTIANQDLANTLLQYQDEFDKWVSKRPTLQALLNKGTVTFDKFKINLLKQIITTDKSSTFNPLGSELANVLLALLTDLETKVA